MPSIRERLAGQRPGSGYGGGNGPAMAAAATAGPAGQGQLVAALDAGEGRSALPPRPVPSVMIARRGRRRPALPADPDSHRFPRQRCSSPRSSTSATARPRSAPSAPARTASCSRRAQIPQVLKHAVIAAEDRHFYTEGGISLTGIVRAAYDDVIGSGGLQGGSTITEQFAKNYYASIGTSRTVSTQAQGDPRRDQALAREVQGLDPDPVPEHDLPRQQRLRRRRGRRRPTSASRPASSTSRRPPCSPP